MVRGATSKCWSPQRLNWTLLTYVINRVSIRAFLLTFVNSIVLFVWKRKLTPLRGFSRSKLKSTVTEVWKLMVSHANPLKPGCWVPAWSGPLALNSPRPTCHSHPEEIYKLENRWQCFEAAARSGAGTRDERSAGKQKHQKDQESEHCKGQQGLKSRAEQGKHELRGTETIGC